MSKSEDALIDQLLEDYQKPEDVLGEDGGLVGYFAGSRAFKCHAFKWWRCGCVIAKSNAFIPQCTIYVQNQYI